ncbi:MAG: poly-beta-1,6-N-acetyl-D-glucosamine biosynthesis protein PgaD [Acinetobacter sp.]
MSNSLQKIEINTANIIIEDETLLDLPEYIDRPEYVKNQSVNYALQAVGWLLFMALFMPFITLLLWWFGLDNIYSYVLQDKSQMTHFNITNIAMIILILGGILLTWASYNWIRFYNKELRTSPPNTPTRIFAAQFNCDPKQITELKNASNLTLYYDEDGILKKFEMNYH